MVASVAQCFPCLPRFRHDGGAVLITDLPRDIVFLVAGVENNDTVLREGFDVAALREADRRSAPSVQRSGKTAVNPIPGWPECPPHPADGRRSARW